MDMQRIRALQQQLGRGGYGSPSSVPEIQNARQQGQMLSLNSQNLSAYNRTPAIQALRARLFGKNPTQPGPVSPGMGGQATQPGMKQPQTRPGPVNPGMVGQASGNPGVQALRQGLQQRPQGGGAAGYFRHMNAGNWSQPRQSTPLEDYRRGMIPA